MTSSLKLHMLRKKKITLLEWHGLTFHQPLIHVHPLSCQWLPRSFHWVITTFWLRAPFTNTSPSRRINCTLLLLSERFSCNCQCLSPLLTVLPPLNAISAASDTNSRHGSMLLLMIISEYPMERAEIIINNSILIQIFLASSWYSQEASDSPMPCGGLGHHWQVQTWACQHLTFQ